MSQTDFSDITYRQVQTGRIFSRGMLRFTPSGVSFLGHATGGAAAATVTLAKKNVSELVFVQTGPQAQRLRRGAMVEVVTTVGARHQFLGFRADDQAALEKAAREMDAVMSERLLSWAGQTWGALKVRPTHLTFEAVADGRSPWNGAELFEIPMQPVRSALMAQNELTVALDPAAPGTTGGVQLVQASFVAQDADATRNAARAIENFAKVGAAHTETAVEFRNLQFRSPPARFDVALGDSGVRMVRRAADGSSAGDERIVRYTDIRRVIKVVDPTDSADAAEGGPGSIVCAVQLTPSAAASMPGGDPFMVVAFPADGERVTLPVRGRPTRLRAAPGAAEPAAAAAGADGAGAAGRERVDVFTIANLPLTRATYDEDAVAELELRSDAPGTTVAPDGSFDVDAVSGEAHVLFTSLLRAFNSRIALAAAPPADTVSVPASYNGHPGSLHFMSRYALYLARPTMVIVYSEIAAAHLDERTGAYSKDVFSLKLDLRPPSERGRASIIPGRKNTTAVAFSQLPRFEGFDAISEVLRKHNVSVAAAAAGPAGGAAFDEMMIPDSDSEDVDFDVAAFEDSAESADEAFEAADDSDLEREVADVIRTKPGTARAAPAKAKAEPTGNMYGLDEIEFSDD